MRLPRRVPWASIAELDQVCSWIFADETDLESKRLAVNRLSAWRATTYLPHALESTLALLVVILQDDSSQGQSVYLTLRQSYAAAIIRLVNGLVDPLQLGTYARSIASIAAQLGLPAWLVELRHAATHEELPSLELLRDAARESMTWLLHNYFLLTINPSSQPQATLLRPLTPTLKRYRSLLKTVTRDASLRTRYKAEINATIKDIEKWVIDAKVAANIDVGASSWEEPLDGLGDGEQDIKEKWALGQLCNALLEKGALVPMSKKKRVFPPDSFMPPTFSVYLWSPLLTQLQQRYPDLRNVLAHRIVSHLLYGSTPTDFPAEVEAQIPDMTPHDLSFDMCLARWAMWLINTWNSEDRESDMDLGKDVAATLITAFGPGGSDGVRDRKAAKALLQQICTTNPDLEAAADMLLSSKESFPPREWHSDDIAVMDERLGDLLSANNSDTFKSQSHQSVAIHDTESSVSGWCLPSGWKPCPIGIYSITN